MRGVTAMAPATLGGVAAVLTGLVRFHSRPGAHCCFLISVLVALVASGASPPRARAPAEALGRVLMNEWPIRCWDPVALLRVVARPVPTENSRASKERRHFT